MGKLTERQEWTLAELCQMHADRESAAKAFDAFYFTGESCRNGHFMSPRLVHSGACVECKRDAQAKYRKSDKGKSTARHVARRIYQDNPEYWRTAARVRYYQTQLDKNLNELSELSIDSDS